MEARMVDLDQQSIARQDLQREIKADEQTYLTYLAKREQERMSDALDTTRIANVAIAVPPAIPVLPAFGWPIVVLAGVCIATIAGIGSAYAVDYLDSSFQTVGQLTDGLGIPVVVALPRANGLARGIGYLEGDS
jgi:polysaccharide biosynthesis protein PslE